MALFGKTAYYPGCILKFQLPEIDRKYKEILHFLSVSFEEQEIGCCGMPAIRNGYRREADAISSKQIKGLKGASKIITPCPQCFSTFKELIPGLKIEHISRSLFENKKRIARIRTNITNEQIAYFSPCAFANMQDNAEKKGIDFTMQFLASIGYDVKEIKGQCCGGALMHAAPKIANKAGKLLEAEFKNANKIVTSCPYCYLHLKQIYKDKVYELSELIRPLIQKEE